jgi:hypothetical protein
MDFDPSSLDTTGDITLVLGQRTTGVKGFRVAMHTAVEAEVRAICEQTRARLDGLTPVEYVDDLSFDPHTHYLVVPLEKLVTHRPRRGRVAAGEERPLVEVDAASRKVLSEASSLPQISATEIEKKSFLFYSAVVGDDPSSRTAFVSKLNPYKAALSGKLLASFGDRLRRVEGPLLAFERTFDMVVTEDVVAVLDPGAFEKVFRDIDAMRERIPAWSKAVSDVLPIDASTAEQIQRACEKSTRIARQARGIFERGKLKAFSAADIREEMKRQGLDASRMVKQGKLVLEDEDIAEVLKLIDERLYKGWHTRTGWDVGTRAKRS